MLSPRSMLSSTPHSSQSDDLAGLSDVSSFDPSELDELDYDFLPDTDFVPHDDNVANPSLASSGASSFLRSSTARMDDTSQVTLRAHGEAHHQLAFPRHQAGYFAPSSPLELEPERAHELGESWYEPVSRTDSVPSSPLTTGARLAHPWNLRRSVLYDPAPCDMASTLGPVSVAHHSVPQAQAELQPQHQEKIETKVHIMASLNGHCFEGVLQEIRKSLQKAYPHVSEIFLDVDYSRFPPRNPVDFLLIPLNAHECPLPDQLDITAAALVLPLQLPVSLGTSFASLHSTASSRFMGLWELIGLANAAPEYVRWTELVHSSGLAFKENVKLLPPVGEGLERILRVKVFASEIKLTHGGRADWAGSYVSPVGAQVQAESEPMKDEQHGESPHSSTSIATPATIEPKPGRPQPKTYTELMGKSSTYSKVAAFALHPLVLFVLILVPALAFTLHLAPAVSLSPGLSRLSDGTQTGASQVNAGTGRFNDARSVAPVPEEPDSIPVTWTPNPLDPSSTQDESFAQDQQPVLADTSSDRHHVDSPERPTSSSSVVPEQDPSMIELWNELDTLLETLRQESAQARRLLAQSKLTLYGALWSTHKQVRLLAHGVAQSLGRTTKRSAKAATLAQTRAQHEVRAYLGFVQKALEPLAQGPTHRTQLVDRAQTVLKKLWAQPVLAHRHAVRGARSLRSCSASSWFGRSSSWFGGIDGEAQGKRPRYLPLTQEEFRAMLKRTRSQSRIFNWTGNLFGPRNGPPKWARPTAQEFRMQLRR